MPFDLDLTLAYLRNPRSVGTIVPASSSLAIAMAREACRGAPPVVVEVGGGTGALTQALLAEMPRQRRLVVVEQNEMFAQKLRLRFPGVEVHNRCGSALTQLDLDPQRPLVIVSSLPLMSMPREAMQRCVDAMLAVLQRHPKSRLVQYIYAAPYRPPPFGGIPAGWRWQRAATVWSNFPPANVWALDPT